MNRPDSLCAAEGAEGGGKMLVLFGWNQGTSQTCTTEVIPVGIVRRCICCNYEMIQVVTAVLQTSHNDAWITEEENVNSEREGGARHTCLWVFLECDAIFDSLLSSSSSATAGGSGGVVTDNARERWHVQTYS